MASRLPIVIGIGGSMGSGKSGILRYLQQLNFNCFDADLCVHELYENKRKSRIISELKHQIPQSYNSTNHTIDRKELSKAISLDPPLLKVVESIVHPEIQNQRYQFLDKNSRELMVFCEEPLLFEKYIHYKPFIHHTINCFCDEETRENRVLKREGMTKSKFDFISSNQLSNKEKMILCDYSIKVLF